MNNILNILPINLKESIHNLNCYNDITEIRLRVNKKVIINISNVEIILDYIATLRDLLDVLCKVSSNSIYSIQNDINQGFVTIKGGHRIGICGEVVIENDKIKNIKNINSMNIRVARQLIGVADKVMNNIIKDNVIYNTLIVSPPNCGKTTILRDIIRQLSNGYEKNKGVTIGIIDERGEIASVNNGIEGLDVGSRTDILSNVPKHIGIEMLIRSMGVKVIATDEIGSDLDIEAIKKATLAGINFVFTMHGNSLNDIYKRKSIKELIFNGYFTNIIILSNDEGPGTIKQVHKIDIEDREVC